MRCGFYSSKQYLRKEQRAPRLEEETREAPGRSSRSSRRLRVFWMFRGGNHHIQRICRYESTPQVIATILTKNQVGGLAFDHFMSVFVFAAPEEEPPA